MKTYIKHSIEFKNEVIAEAKNTSPWLAAKKYNLKTSTVEYWCKPKVQERKKIKNKERWDQNKINDPEFLNKWAEQNRKYHNN